MSLLLRGNSTSPIQCLSSRFPWPRPNSPDVLFNEVLHCSLHLSALIHLHFAVGALLLSPACSLPLSASGLGGWRRSNSSFINGCEGAATSVWVVFLKSGLRNTWRIFVCGILKDGKFLFEKTHWVNKITTDMILPACHPARKVGRYLFAIIDSCCILPLLELTVVQIKLSNCRHSRPAGHCVCLTKEQKLKSKSA